MKICVYAFSNTAYFFTRLIQECESNRDAIEWSAVLPRWHHRQNFSSVLPTERLLYLYEHFDAQYAGASASDSFGIQALEDNELLCLLKDKGGYLGLASEEQLRRAVTIAKIYREFLLRVKPDFMLFPDVEVVDGFLLLSLCKTLGIKPLYYVGLRFLGGGFFSSDCCEGLPCYFGGASEKNIEQANRFLESFLIGKPQPLESSELVKASDIPIMPLWKRAPLAIRQHLKYERLYAGEDGWVTRIKVNVARYLNAYRRWYFRKVQLRFFHLRDECQARPARYVLYALQYTPESSINGLEPYYVDQMRAIDLLLIGMPSDCRLIVKEHPAMAGIRGNSFYKELKRKPGVILAAPSLSTRRLMEGAAVVASVTGTIGFESYLLGKPCLLFGRNFFSHLCAFAEGPSSIRRVLVGLMEQFEAPSIEQRGLELARLLNVRYPILLSDPLVDPAVVSDQNLRAYRQAMLDHIARLKGVEPQTES